MEFLVGEGRSLALFGIFLIILGVFYIPSNWDAALNLRSARFGIAISGVTAIVMGFIIATLGG